MEYTKGEWEADSATVYALNRRGVNIFYASFQSGNTDNGERTKEDVLIANAQLASAAPDMYEALTSIRDEMRQQSIRLSIKTTMQLKNVLAKAEGK